MHAAPLSDERLEEVVGGTMIPYIVRSKDTIESIAERFHCTAEQICRWNNIRNPQEIRANQKLMIRF